MMILPPEFLQHTQFAGTADSRLDGAPRYFRVDTDDICVVCLENEIDTCLLPCRHVAVCSACVRKMQPAARGGQPEAVLSVICPICRGEVDRVQTFCAETGCLQVYRVVCSETV